MMNPPKNKAFTLIELSIVLVIIGLIVGGVLVGRDLIGTSTVRAQISQMEKLQTAVNTFRGKFNNYLPGDIPEPDATRFGFAARGTLQGQGDGNGLIEGMVAYAGPYPVGMNPSGETLMFWVDVSTARLIENSFTVATSTTTPTAVTNPINLTSSPTKINDFLPEAKIGGSNFISIYSDGGINYFNLSVPINMGVASISSKVGLTVAQAYGIDRKTDDGFPATGKVIAVYQNGFPCGAQNGTCASHLFSMPETVTTPSATSCFDNNSTFAAKMQYSITYNNGANVNCALSFKFQ